MKSVFVPLLFGILCTATGETATKPFIKVLLTPDESVASSGSVIHLLKQKMVGDAQVKANQSPAASPPIRLAAPPAA